MKVFTTKIMALGGLIALMATAGAGAFAQDYGRWNHGDGDGYTRHEFAHERLQRLHRAYYHAINNGNRAAARRAHLHAKAIRAHLREEHRDRF